MKAKHPPPMQAEHPNSPVKFAAEFGRQQLVSTIDRACAVFRGFECMRSIQQHAAQQALSHYMQAAQRLHAPCDTNQLMQVQNDLLQWEMEAATRYWQDLGEAAMGLQSEMFTSYAQLGQQQIWPEVDASRTMPMNGPRSTTPEAMSYSEEHPAASGRQHEATVRPHARSHARRAT